MKPIIHSAALFGALLSMVTSAQAGDKLELMDTFNFEMASAATFAPDGKHIVYTRRSFDVMTDRARSNLWMIDADGENNRPLLSGTANYSGASYSPDGTRLAYVATDDGAPQIYIRWMDTGQTARATNVQNAPSRLVWSPDGTQLAFTMFVPASQKSFVSLPSAPEGAKWTPKPVFVDKTLYRRDGSGYVGEGFTQLFVLPADGGTPRQLTHGKYNHGGAPTWSADGKTVYISADHNDDIVANPNDSEIFSVDVPTGEMAQLTDRRGPDMAPQMSPDGRYLAYLGYDDKGLSSQNSRLYVRDMKSGNVMDLTPRLDRSVDNVQWAPDGKYVYFQFTDHGKMKVARVDLRGRMTLITENMGGLAFGRPYAAGTYAVGKGGRVAFTFNDPHRPADLAVTDGKTEKVLTALNEDVLAGKQIAKIEEITVKSSVDGRDIQGWLALPPGYDANKNYPLILEIHGGPHAAYGPHWSTEVQNYAAAGYVVLFTNPRGSTSYGEEFANLIHHCYPCGDYQDLMDLVDETIAKKSIDTGNLFVTGGSGGGVLTSWIIGKTDRFRAAVVAKPVINWISFALTADAYPYFTKYWLDGTPWDNFEHYWKRSPLSLVGNVSTPTMLMTGEQDHRTPISETEQYYQALKLRGVETAMVRIQNSGHGIASKPSNLNNKVAYILAWFEKHAKTDTEGN